jgi:putative membrane protein
MLYLKSVHIIFVVSWFAGLFYLPRLYVYHAMSSDGLSNERFKVMERKLFWGIMTPAGVLSVGSGLWLWFGYGFSGGWLHLKVAFVVLLIAYHCWCWKAMRDFKLDRNRHTHVFYRWMNEVPTLILIVSVLLVVVKPSF